MRIRRVIFNFHLYMGLTAGLFLVLSGLTGSMIVFREEIETLIHPEWMQADVGSRRTSLQTVLDTVKRAYPEDKLLSVRMPRAPQQTYLLKMNDAHGLFVYADPYSGKLLGGHRQDETFMGWLALVHTELLIGERGKTVLGVSALLLLCLSVTGLILWWPRNGKISRGFKIAWSAPTKKLVFDIHRALGIYAVLFLLIIAFTGVSLVFNKPLVDLINFVTNSPSRPPQPLSDPDGGGQVNISVDDLLHEADRILPAPTTWVNFPQTPQAPLVVRKKLPGELHPNGRSFIYFDQYTGRALLVENALTAPPGTRIYNNLYPLHIGEAGGLTTRVLQLLVGFSPLILFATGYIMWRNRGKVKGRKKSDRDDGNKTSPKRGRGLRQPNDSSVLLTAPAFCHESH